MDIAIIGGGITGLAAAYYLEQFSAAAGRPVRVTVLEQAARVGGKIMTVREGDFLIEGGPDSFLNQKPWGSALCREVGLGGELLPANPDQRNVYLLHRGKLEPFPTGFRLAVPTEWMPFLRTPLLSWRGKARVALEWFIPPRRNGGDESLAAFLRRRIGTEATDRLAGPVMSGIYTADPERLSVRASWSQFVEMEQQAGSLLRGMMRARRRAPPPRRGHAPSLFVSLRGGMESLVDALCGRIAGDIQRERTVTAVQADRGGWRIAFERGEPASYHAVVLACPADRAAGLTAALQVPLAECLRRIRYVSTASVSLGFHAKDVHPVRPLDGYGFMVPSSENQVITACTWSSTKFAGRAPDGMVLLRAFVGGDGRQDIVGESDDELIRTVRVAYAGILGIRADPVHARVFRWIKGNPQYDVGHLDRVRRLEEAMAALPGLYLTGSAFRGVSVPDCIRQARETAERVLAAQG